MENFDSYEKFFSNIKTELQDLRDLPRKTFRNFKRASIIDEDTYLLAQSFSSIINSIIDTKIDIALRIINSIIETISFLKTYDDKYLSNTPYLINQSFKTEKIFIKHIMLDISSINNYLEDFLTYISRKEF